MRCVCDGVCVYIYDGVCVGDGVCGVYPCVHAHVCRLRPEEDAGCPVLSSVQWSPTEPGAN